MSETQGIIKVSNGKSHKLVEFIKILVFYKILLLNTWENGLKKRTKPYDRGLVVIFIVIYL